MLKNEVSYRTSTFHQVFDALLPSVCIHCENRLDPDDNAVCAECRERLEACRRARIRSVATGPGGDDRMNILSLWIYATGSPVRTLHRALKYGGRRDIGQMTGREMGRIARRHLAFVDRRSLVLPVPSHPIRIMERGYNHAELLAQGVSAELRLGCRPDGLRRIRHSVSQSSVTRSARPDNVRDAFAVADPDMFSDRPVIIVDDVFTTGATLVETASILRASGAAFLTGLTMAIRIVR